jgi:hypothetical protein
MRLLVALFALISFFANSQIKKGLVASFSFNKGAVEDDGGKFVGKGYGIALAPDRFGNNGKAMFLQGNENSFINLGTSDSLKPKAGSISLWIKIDQPIYKGTGVQHNPIYLTRSQNTSDNFNEAIGIAYEFELRKLNVNVSQTYVYPVQTSYLRQWYHLVLTYDSRWVCCYLNGDLQGKVPQQHETVFLSGDSILVGRLFGKRNQRYLQGSIDDIFIYNRPLSAAEVVSLYEAPNPNRAAVALNWGLGILSLIGFAALLRLFVKRRVALALQKQKGQNDLLKRSYEQEIKTLKAQMNPHFIFNALNSIQQFILINENEKAQQYLSKFSKLIRKILESSTADSLNLHDEIRILRGYIEIESLRFNNVFEYRISLSDQLENSLVQIPHFLIQPFVENAIWHGLLPRDGAKSLDVTFDLADPHTLRCMIDDNGIGRKASTQRRPLDKGASLAIDFVQQRLELMSKMNGRPYHIQIIDKANSAGQSEGTRVILTLPILKYTENVPVHHH